LTHIHNSTLQGSLALNILSKEKEKKRKASKTLEPKEPWSVELWICVKYRRCVVPIY
jgi:hypothetical protein